MERHLRNGLLPALLLVLAMPVCDALTLEEVLGRMPPSGPQEAEQLYAEALAAGDALLVAMCMAVMPPEISGDAPAQFALYGLTQHVVAPNRDQERSRVARLFEQAFLNAEHVDVKRFFLRLLHLCGDADTARFLAPRLDEPSLLEDVVLALEALGSDGAAVLNAALPNATEPGKQHLQAALARMGHADDIGGAVGALSGAELLASNPKRWAAWARHQAETDSLKSVVRHCRELLTQDIPAQERCVVLETLVDLAGEDAIPEVRAALASSEAQYRGQALRLAERLPGTRASRAWVRAIKHMDPSLRPRMIALLGGRDDAVARRAARKALRDKDAAVRLAAYESVTRYPDKRVTSDLARALIRAQDDHEIWAIRDALLRMPGEDVTDAAAKIARHTDVRKRAIGLEIIGRRAADTHLPMVRNSLNDSEAMARRAALQALGALAEPEDIGRLLDHCVNEAQDAESNAARDALLACAADGGMGDAVIADIIGRLPQSGDREPRLLRLLSMLGAAGGLPALRDYALQSALAGRDASSLAAMDALSAGEAGRAHLFLLEAYRSLDAEHLRLAAARNFATVIARLRDTTAQKDALTTASESARSDEERAVFAEALAALEKKN